MKRTVRPIASVWCQETFTQEIARKIAAAGCPNLAIIGDVAAIAEAMNGATAHLMAALSGSTLPSEEEAFCSELAEAALTLSTKIGRRVANTASRIDFNPSRFRAGFEFLKEMRSYALSAAANARSAKKRGRPPTPEINGWLNEMMRLFEAFFGRPAGTTTDVRGDRGGPFPRFVAEVSTHLLMNDSIRKSPGIEAALVPLQDPKHVARCLVTRRRGGANMAGN